MDSETTAHGQMEKQKEAFANRQVWLTGKSKAHWFCLFPECLLGELLMIYFIFSLVGQTAY